MLAYLHIKSNKETTKRDRELKEWLFISLYAINKSVKKPTDMTLVAPKKGVVISPTKDPMSEFTGARSDFYE